jgi:hypothetical protein
MSLPRDFLELVEAELHRNRRAPRCNRRRTSALHELHEVTLAVAAALDRPITVFDVIRSTNDRDERERRARLIRELRGGCP